MRQLTGIWSFFAMQWPVTALFIPSLCFETQCTTAMNLFPCISCVETTQMHTDSPVAGAGLAGHVRGHSDAEQP